MRSLDVIMMVVIPLVPAVVLAAVVMSGRMTPRRRTQAELAIIALMYPALCGGLAWFAVENIGEGDGLGAGLQGCLAAMLAVQGLSMAGRRLKEPGVP